MKQDHDHAPPVSLLALSQGDHALGEGEIRLQQGGGVCESGWDSRAAMIHQPG